MRMICLLIILSVSALSCAAEFAILEDKVKISGTASVDVLKLKKGPWYEFDLLLIEVFNPAKTPVKLKVTLERRAVDDQLLQPENPKYTKTFELKPGDNSLIMNVSDACNSPAREITVENIVFTAGKGLELVLKTLKLTQSEE